MTEKIKSPLQTWDDPPKLKGKVYRIPCTWEMYGVMEVRADDSTALPMGNSAYVEASFEVDEEIVEDYNREDCA